MNNLLKFVLFFLGMSAAYLVCASSAAQRGDLGTNPLANFSTESNGNQDESSSRSVVSTPTLSNNVIYDNSSKPVASNATHIVPKLTVVTKTASGPIKTLDKIVAFVNKNVVTSHQIDQQVSQTVQNFKSKGINLPNMTDVRSKVTDQLIMQQIQLDLAARSGIKTSDIEVTNAINSIVQQQHTTLDAFKADLTKQNVSFEDFRRQIKDQLTMDKLKQRDVDSRVIVNDDEVTRVLNSEIYKKRIDYNLSDIIISIPEQATLEVIKQKQALAKSAYNELKSGASFYNVSAKYSNAPNALTGGELGWRTSAALPPLINNNLENLKIGEYTNIIQMPVGYFIFKINDIKKHGEQQIVHQYHVRHILIKVNELTSDNEAQQKILSIKQALNKDSNDPKQLNLDFIKYAKQYSQDTSSINGGDIGWVSLGDTVPAFESAMVKLPIGQVSDPIRTLFGWHILQVLDVRDSNMTNDKEKAAIRKELQENKAQMLYAQWLREIRDAAYVKMNDD